MYQYDLIVVGSGPAGRRGAIQAAKLGKTVLVIERGKSANRDGTTLRQMLTKQLETTLHTLAGCALLIS